MWPVVHPMLLTHMSEIVAVLVFAEHEHTLGTVGLPHLHGVDLGEAESQVAEYLLNILCIEILFAEGFYFFPIFDVFALEGAWLVVPVQAEILFQFTSQQGAGEF